jgi:hypothetical protein
MVRREDNGKLFIIGVYDADIQTVAFPLKLEVTLLARISGVQIGETKFEIAAYLDETRLMHGTADISFHDPGSVFVPFPRIPIDVPHGGTIRFDLKIGDAEWKTVWKGPVSFRK